MKMLSFSLTQVFIIYTYILQYYKNNTQTIFIIKLMNYNADPAAEQRGKRENHSTGEGTDTTQRTLDTS